MVCSKMNGARSAPALGFSIVEPGRIEWTGTSDLTADEVFAASDSRHPDESGPAVAEAVEWLQAALADGSLEAREVKRQAAENSIAARTLVRAKAKLGVRSTKEAFTSKWFWALPETVEEPPA